VARLDEYLSSAPPDKGANGARSYLRSLALAGKGEADQTDVSSHKGRYLAEVYASWREG
jgi:hypothetical protein